MTCGGDDVSRIARVPRAACQPVLRGAVFVIRCGLSERCPLLIGAECRKTPGPTLTFRCPACGCDQASASSYQYGERAVLLHAIPVSPYTETNYVKCSQCSELFVSEVSVFDLPQYAPHELPRLLRRRVPLVPATLAVCGILLFPFPVIGLLVNGIALLLNWRRPRHWTRTMSWVGTLMAAFINILFLILLLIDLTVGL